MEMGALVCGISSRILARDPISLHLMKMRRIWVDSSCVTSIGYDAVRRELHIEFRESGDVYSYFDVPADEYEAFLAAESKGTYLNEIFKPRNYKYRVVSRRRTGF